ncbi:sulfotransferase [Emcibacter sp. SYSU 3D8]|uniref:sulfotransferase n=1 Tax=Emcibacter sp. SYSU 3D8 TaxID=3133969 RepID=UPI0031FED1A1
MSERPPIIVLGANHAGTRLVVDVLRTLGSAAGRIDNEWLEDRTFLEVHRRLISHIAGKGWTRTIFDMGFVQGFHDDAHLVPDIRGWLAEGLPDSFPDRSRPWHWKCPTAVMFLPSWLEIYPDALFVHIERQPVDVARSLVRRRQFLDFGRATAFYEAMNRRVLDARPAMTNYLHVSIESLADNLPSLAEMAGLSPDHTSLGKACASIRRQPRRGWQSDRSLLGNLWETTTNLRAAVRERNGRR